VLNPIPLAYKLTPDSEIIIPEGHSVNNTRLPDSEPTMPCSYSPNVVYTFPYSELVNRFISPLEIGGCPIVYNLIASSSGAPKM
jgi:hypothetical protein